MEKFFDFGLWCDRRIEDVSHWLWSWCKYPGIAGFCLILLAVITMAIWIWVGEYKTAFATTVFGNLILLFACGVECELRRYSRKNLP